MRDRRVRRFRSGLDDVEDRIHGHAVGRIGDELAPLREVPPHRHQPLQRFGLERPNEARCPPPQRRGLRAARGLELGGDLQQIAHDHLIVPGGLRFRVLVDRLCDDSRLGGSRAGVFRRRRQGRPRQAHPQLGGSRIPFPGGGAGLVGELQALVRERVQLHVRLLQLGHGDANLFLDRRQTLRSGTSFNRRNFDRTLQLADAN